jgi:hypothetical protein
MTGSWPEAKRFAAHLQTDEGVSLPSGFSSWTCHARGALTVSGSKADRLPYVVSADLSLLQPSSTWRGEAQFILPTLLHCTGLAGLIFAVESGCGASHGKARLRGSMNFMKAADSCFCGTAGKARHS